MLFFILALAVVSGAAVGAVSERVVIDVCTILNQDREDIDMCCDKARGTYISSGEGPIITYLCCLGYFEDVKIDYMNQISFDLLLHIVKTGNGEELLSEAQFVAQCQDINAPPLTLMNYLAWKGGPETPSSCRKKV